MERVAREQQREHGAAGRRLTAVPASAYISFAGRMAEWLCRGLQILVQRFDSASGLQGGANAVGVL